MNKYIIKMTDGENVTVFANDYRYDIHGLFAFFNKDGKEIALFMTHYVSYVLQMDYTKE